MMLLVVWKMQNFENYGSLGRYRIIFSVECGYYLWHKISEYAFLLAS